MGIGKWLWNENARDLVSGARAGSKAGARKAADDCRPTAEKLASREIPATEGLTLKKLNSPRGRKATGKLALDLTRITGKVAVAGAAGAAGFLASMLEHYPHDEDNKDDPMLTYDIGPDGPGYYDQMGFKVQNGNDWLDDNKAE